MSTNRELVHVIVGDGVVQREVALAGRERGEKRPAGPTLKLLSLAERKGLAAIA